MKNTKGRSLHKTNRLSKNSIVVNIPSEKAIVYWLNSLGLPSSILVDALEDLSRQGDETIAEVIHTLISVPGENLPVPNTVASALSLLSKTRMWNEMSPSLSNMAPVDIALKVKQNNNKLLRLLMGNLRVLMERKQSKIISGTLPTEPTSPSAFGRTTSRTFSRINNNSNSNSNSRNNNRNSNVNHGNSKSNVRHEDDGMDIVDLENVSGLSDHQLNALQRKVKLMMKAEANGRNTEETKEAAHMSPTRARLKRHTEAWVPNDNWNASTATGKNRPRTATSKLPSAKHKIHSKRGKSFIKGVERVDKNGMVAYGMWDPTYAPSIKKLYELGFSPSQVGRTRKRHTALKRENYQQNGSGNAKTVTFANSYDDSSVASGAYAPSFNEAEKIAISAHAKARRNSALKAAEDRQPWESKLRTPSKRRQRRGGNSSSSNFSSNTTTIHSPRPHNSRAPVSPNSKRTHLPRNSSMALSAKQNEILKWIRQYGVKPCPETKPRMVTAQSIGTAFSNGVLLCELVAHLEIRAGGRGLNQVSKSVKGSLSLEGVQLHPRTTAACTANINVALKVLRNRKKMNPRHLWAAPKIRNGDQMTIWQLLEDIKREYSPRMPQAKIGQGRRKETVAQARRAAAQASTSRTSSAKKKRSHHKIPSQRGSKLSLGIHRDLLGHDNSAIQQGAFGLLDPAETVDMNTGNNNRGSRYQSPHPRMSVNNGKNVGSPLGRGNLRKSKYENPNVLIFHPSKTQNKTSNGGNMTDVQYTFQEVSGDQERVLRSWLMQMGFTVPEYKRNSNSSPLSITKDPIRNGTLLCALVQMLDPEHAKELMTSVKRKPYSVRQARNNIDTALAVLRARMYSAIPSPYLFQAEAIVKGTRAVLWGLLWHLKRVMDSFAPNPAELRSMTKAIIAKREKVKVAHSQEYTAEEKWQLERSLLSWLHSLDVLKVNTVVPRDFVEIDKEVRDGTLLCRTVAAVSGLKVRGWNKKPLKPTIRRENIEKALEAIRNLKGMGKRHALKGDEIYRGERVHILGIFEDLHRFFDDVSPRPTFRKGKETPYFGSHVPAPEDMSLPHPHLAFPPSGTGAALLVGRMEDDVENDPDVLKTAHLDADSAAASASMKLTSSLNTYSNKLSSMQHDQTMSSAFYDDISDIFPHHNEERKQIDANSVGTSRILSNGGQSISSASDMKALSSIFVDRDSSMDIVPLSNSKTAELMTQNNYVTTMTEHSKQALNAAKERHHQRVQKLNLLGHEDDNNDGGTISEMMAEDVLIQWIRSLGVRVEQPDDFHKDTASEFRNGVKFCRIIEAVSHGRGQIRGVNPNPKNIAQCLNNFRRGLEVLRQKSNMPVELLFSEDRLVEGDVDVLVPLLQSIRKAYGQHLIRFKGTSSKKK